MKRLLLLIVVLLALTTACSAEQQAPPASTPPAASLTSDPAQASRESASQSSVDASVSSERAAASAQTDKLMDGVKAAVNKYKTSDTNNRLTEIVTAYCNTFINRGNSHTAEHAEQVASYQNALSAYYNQEWRAGGKWNATIYAAAQQSPGGCQSVATATNTPGG